MKNNKIIILLTIVLLFSFFTGCSSSTPVTPPTPPIDEKQQQEETFKRELEEVKQIVTSTKPMSSYEMDTITDFIDKNKNRNEVKNDLCTFILDKWEEYLKSGKEDENVDSRFTIALSRLYINYPDNQRVQTLNSQHSLSLAIKEVEKQEKEKPKSNNLKSADGNLELTSYGQDKNYVVGMIKNNSNITYAYVQVNINLYDKNDNQVGSTLANVNNLEGRKSWNFKAPVIESNVSKYRVISIDAVK